MPCSFLELVGQVVDEADVEILATEEGVAIGGLHLEDAVADLQHGDVKSAAAEVIDRYDAGVLLVEAVGQRRSGRLVDDAQHLETGDPAGVPWWPGAGSR